MEFPDMIGLAQLSDEQRQQQLSTLFQQLMPLPASEQVSLMKALIQQMAEKATDVQYLNVCKTNLQIAAQLPDSDLKGFLAIRAQAASQLTPNLADRDKKLLQEALGKADPTIQEKIMKNF
ncbi:dehydrogenase [Alicyclobacillaceae bacterium I2511]|nr:dehydrogenase [Alicyclobacillaceae bacterium I2511]